MDDIKTDLGGMGWITNITNLENLIGEHFSIYFRTHPEVPDRIQRPYDKHREYGLLERCQDLPVS